jgi:periplasmic protein CpxP/Spy
MNSRTSVAAITTGLALAGFLASGPVLAGQPGMHHGGPGHDGPMMHMLKDLNLTDAQKSQVKQIMDDEHPKMAPLAQNSWKARQALEQAVHAPVFDENAIRAAATQAGVAEAELAVERGRVSSRIRSVLTADQQKQMDALHQQRMERHHGPWGEGPEDGPDSE